VRVDDVRLMVVCVDQGRSLPRRQAETDVLGQQQPPGSPLDDVQLTLASVR